MKYLPLAALILLATVAHSHAQQLTEFNMKITPVEAETVWKGLRKLPVEDVEVLMAKLRQQLSEQTKTVEPPKSIPAPASTEPKKE